MASFKSWVKAARLRTLPLALASIAMGGFVASTNKDFNLYAVLMAGLTTLLLQILSNFANDYGDFTKGTDDDNRLGPKRTVQSGEITAKEMKMAMFIFSILSLFSGLAMLIFFVQLPLTATILFVGLGIAAIAAAIKYTTGDNPYGYAGYGDIFVFIFFGLVAVLGTFFLATQTWHWSVLLPAIAMGMLSTGVLNLNNIRDYTNDKMKGKKTIAVKLGVKGAIYYHTLLVSIPFLAIIAYNLINQANWQAYLVLLLIPLFIIDLLDIRKLKNSAALDPYLKKLAIKTLLLTLVYGFGLQF